MPRFGSKSRTSIATATSDYDLTTTFTSFTGEYVYDKSASLLLWGNMCSPKAFMADYTVPGKHQLVGYDMSGGTKYGLFSLTSMGSPTRNTTEEFCGEKCYFAYSGIGIPLSGGGASGNAYASGQWFLLQDHNNFTFNTTGTDNAFTISLWYKSNVANSGGSLGGTTGPISYLVNKPFEYGLAVSGDNKLRFTLNSGGSASNTIFVETAANPMSVNDWNHVVITYDGSETAAGMKIYVSGIDKTATTGGAGSYTGMTNGAADIYFGYGAIAGTTLPLASFNIEGAKILEPSIWSAELSGENVLAVYHATKTCILTNSDVDVFRGESGYTSKPPRVLLRDLDNHPGTYHTVHRMGDRDRTGKYNIQYDDTSVINFDKKIVDEFVNKTRGGFKNNNINSKLWNHSNGLEIRKETLVGYNGASFEDGVLVFTGGAPRYLQTKEKVRNATITLELVQGPHNKSTNMFGDLVGLNLEAGLITETLRVQISTNGSDWTTVKTFAPQSLEAFYNSGVGSTSGLIREIRVGPLGPVRNRFRKKIILTPAQIQETAPATSTNGPTASYFVRLYQDTVAGGDPNKAVWGLGRIEIDYYDGQVNYPLLTDLNTTIGKKIVEKRIVTPHTRSDLTTTGRTISGVTDSHLTFSPGEEVSAFDETLAIENLDATSLFDAVGTETEVHPGFTSRLADKTKFVMDLSTNSSEYFGYTTSNHVTEVHGGIRMLGAKQPLMVYYNHTTQRWEPVGSGLDLNNSTNKAFRHMFDAMSSSAVGFGPIGHVVSGSKVLGGGFVDQYARRIGQFAFPVGGRYHSTSSQTIRGEDIGITKPFALEKLVLETDIIFEFPDKSTVLDGLGLDGQRAFALKRHITPGTGSVGAFADDTLRYDFDTKLRYYLPTFFLMRQFESGQYSRDFSPRLNTTGSSTNVRYGVNIPGMFDLDGDGIKEAYVTTRRELIADGQLGILLSGSSGTTFDIKTILENGLRREALYTVAENTTALTGTFKIEFRPRVHQSYRASTYLGVMSEYGANFPVATGSIRMGYEPQERLPQLPIDPLHNQRRLGKAQHPGYADKAQQSDPGYLGKVVLPARTDSSARVAFGGQKCEFSIGDRQHAETVTQNAPYLIFPEDEIIVGCQYPLAEDFPLFGTTQNNNFKNQMKFHGKSRLHLYGSMIKNNREFHEYNNQNLNSDNIHEVIGAEPIIDQFHLETRAELTGTYVDDFTVFRNQYISAIRADLVPFDKAPDQPVLRLTGQMFTTSSVHGTTPNRRYPTRTLSRSNFFTQAKNYQPYDDPTFNHDASVTTDGRVSLTVDNKRLTGYHGEIPATQRFVMLKDQDRIFKDSYYGDNHFFGKGLLQIAASLPEATKNQNGVDRLGTLYDVALGSARDISSNYGTMQTEMLIWYPFKRISASPVPRSGSYGVKTISPKFYFNHRKFGNFSDMIQQSRDSAMFILPSSFRNNYYNPNGGVRKRTNPRSSKLFVTAAFGTYTANIRASRGNPQPDLQEPFFPATVLDTPAGIIPTITAPPVVSVIVTGSFSDSVRLKVFHQVTDPSRITALNTAAANPINNTNQFMTSSIPFFDNEDGRATRHDNLSPFLMM